jgi:hypothetical protein
VAEAGAAAAAESLTTIVSQLRERLLAERSTARPTGASQPAVVSGSSKSHITAVPMTSTRTADGNTAMRYVTAIYIASPYLTPSTAQPIRALVDESTPLHISFIFAEKGPMDG